ncbi:aspartate-semialdehyde dehydrogenase [Candidatus Woesearchaeota archaeon]|nr:aspartate-semialdehyde dehydrogenase [Candidatus Woesearchaeota archaeon]
MKKLNVGVFGATGMVGQELLKVLYDRRFPVKNLRVYAGQSAGTRVNTPFGEKIVEDANTADYSELELAFFAIGKKWPKENAPKAVEAGCYIIDNSSTFRYDKEVPLVIPEINPQAIGDSRLIANPNCTTAIATIPLWQIYQNFGLKRVVISTYQAASGAGKAARNELKEQAELYLDGEELFCKEFQYPLAFNVIPHIDEFQPNGYTKEEMKVVWETRKIFGDEKILISCTAVRIPTDRAHAESITVETEKIIDLERVVEIFGKTSGIEVRDDPGRNVYPMPLTATGKYDVEVGRIRRDLAFGDKGLSFFVCGDQIDKGAALNAVQIGELVAQRYQ